MIRSSGAAWREDGVCPVKQGVSLHWTWVTRPLQFFEGELARFFSMLGWTWTTNSVSLRAAKTLVTPLIKSDTKLSKWVIRFDGVQMYSDPETRVCFSDNYLDISVVCSWKQTSLKAQLFLAICFPTFLSLLCACFVCYTRAHTHICSHSLGRAHTYTHANTCTHML